MKHLKKFLLMVTTVLFCMISFWGNSLETHAEETTPTTYYLKYVASVDQFRYMVDTWQEGQQHWGLTSLKENIKNGDLLVIDGTDGHGIELSLNVNLSNLTVVNGDLVIVTANSIENFYGLNGSKSVVNGNVTNAYVYENSLGNFNNNVTNLTVSSGKNPAPLATVAVAGTCDYFHIENGMTCYSFKTNTLRMENGDFKTASENYSLTAPATSTTSTTSTDSDEYDDVPKTADSRFNPLWLALLSLVCFVGSVGIRKIK